MVQAVHVGSQSAHSAQYIVVAPRVILSPAHPRGRSQGQRQWVVGARAAAPLRAALGFCPSRLPPKGAPLPKAS